MSANLDFIRQEILTGRTSWINKLVKESLIEVCRYYDIVADETSRVEELRKALNKCVKLIIHENAKIEQKNSSPKKTKYSGALSD